MLDSSSCDLVKDHFKAKHMDLPVPLQKHLLSAKQASSHMPACLFVHCLQHLCSLAQPVNLDLNKQGI